MDYNIKINITLIDKISIHILNLRHFLHSCLIKWIFRFYFDFLGIRFSKLFIIDFVFHLGLLFKHILKLLIFKELLLNYKKFTF